MEPGTAIGSIASTGRNKSNAGFSRITLNHPASQFFYVLLGGAETQPLVGSLIEAGGCNGRVHPTVSIEVDGLALV